MADFNQNKRYNHLWQNSKFRDLSYSGSYISQFTNNVGYLTPVNTSSLLVNASFSDPNLRFAQGNGSTFNVDISSLTVTFAATASYIDGGTF